MKLFTFLIIDPSIIENKLLFERYDRYNFKNTTNSGLKRERERYYESLQVGENVKHNRIYTLKENKNLVFMSFKYQNICGEFKLGNNGYKWAYIIIDPELKSELAISNMHWSTNADKKSSKTKEIEGKRRYWRIGGHIGRGDNGKLIHRFHEYVFSGKLDKIDRNKRIHHTGHSFDNRVDYLQPRISKKLHDYIHRKWEPKNGYYRAGGIGFNTGITDNIGCNCKITNLNEQSKQCEECNATLYIKTEQQLKVFIESLNEPEYSRLGSKWPYEKEKMPKHWRDELRERQIEETLNRIKIADEEKAMEQKRLKDLQGVIQRARKREQ